MAKVFYTERDIEDLAARGVTALDVDDNVVITDVARDKAMTLGIRLVRPAGTSNGHNGAAGSSDEVVAKVRAAVIARLGPGVDHALLDAVITRVVAQLK